MEVTKKIRKLNIVGNITLRSVLIIIAFIESLYLLANKIPREGLGFMWTLPFTFGLCIYLFPKIVSYHKGGIGLKIYYIIAMIRYLIQPFLIQITNGEISGNRMSVLEASSYQMAIFISCLELIIACLTIRYYYPRIVKNEMNKKQKKYADKIYFSGWIALTVFTLILLARINVWFPALNILGFKENVSDRVIILEATILNCLKAFGFVVALNKTIKYSVKNIQYYLCLLLTIVLGIFNFITYFGSNRSFIIETILVTIVLLYYEFPRYRHTILVVTVPVGYIITYVMVVTKQFGLESANDFSASILSMQYISNQVEEYANGLWCIGQSYQASIGLSVQQSFEAFCKELTDALTVISAIPGFKWIPMTTNEMLSSAEVMKYSFQIYDRGQMLSFSGDFFITFNAIGILVFPIANIIVIRLLTIFEVKSKIIKNIYYKYMYLWLACLFGLTHCYNIQTLIYCSTKFILFYWLILKVNDLKIKLST